MVSDCVRVSGPTDPPQLYKARGKKKLVKFIIQEMVLSIITTCGRSSTLPVGSLGVLEQAHMGGNIHLQGRH
jgi:hypothetical protein